MACGRREFLKRALAVSAGGSLATFVPSLDEPAVSRKAREGAGVARSSIRPTRPIRLFLCGDVMPGRGIDQILPHPSPPVLYESYVRDARRYVALAEEVSGEIPRPVAYDYIWGDALAVLGEQRPDVRIINLETSITRSDGPWPKGINYRLHPDNGPVLKAAGIDCCVLANNHVLDWGREGLSETLQTLEKLGILTAGAGADLGRARAPAILPLAGGGRVLVFAGATSDSGVPAEWGADRSRSGVQHLPDLSASTVSSLARIIRQYRREGDRVVFSVHWGGNWGYEISQAQQNFAHALIDEAVVDLIHGHSSHHVKALEVYQGHLILYGCGDFINDYEGIEGREEFRGDLALMYFPALDAASGHLLELRLVPTRLRRFRVERASSDDRAALLGIARREYGRFGCDVEEEGDEFLLRWARPKA